MWLWGTLFDLGKTVFRGIGWLYVGLIGLMMTGGLALAFVLWAITPDPGGARALASEMADRNNDPPSAWGRDCSSRRERCGAVAAQWERDRREQEYYDKYNSSYDEDDY